MTKIVTTPGVVLQKRGIGEAHASVVIFTESHGLLRAVAKSARHERSKLRFGLEPLTIARFSLVRGKLEWKLIGVEAVIRPLSSNTPSRTAAGRIARLLQRLVHGEEGSRMLYGVLTEGLSLLAVAFEKEERESIECVIVLRILFHLGYLPQTAELAPFVIQDGLSVTLAAQAAAARSRLIQAINESLSATGL